MLCFFCFHIDGDSLGKSSSLCDCSLIPQVGPWAVPPAEDPMAQKSQSCSDALTQFRID